MHKTIADGLEPNECRWVMTDDNPKTFCCEPVVPSLSYCLAHAKRVYLPTQRRRPKAPIMLPVDPLPVDAKQAMLEHNPELADLMEG